jgi:hypothetical protein
MAIGRLRTLPGSFTEISTLAMAAAVRGVSAVAPTVSLDGKVVDDVRLSEAVLGMFSTTSSASWSCGYGRIEWRWRR